MFLLTSQISSLSDDRGSAPNLPFLQVIAAIGIILGLLALVIPYFGAMGSCGPFMDAVCGDRCPGYECSDSDKEVRSAFWVKGERKVFLGFEDWGWKTHLKEGKRYVKIKTHLFQSSRYDILTGFKVAIYIFFLESF